MSHLHLGLDPGPDNICLISKLSAQSLIILLTSVFFNQGLISLGY